MVNNDMPNFTPPTPTFTPPSTPGHDGPCCHYHQNEPAVDRCARCGKYICQDCAETYTVNDDEYKGKALCYDCCKEIVADNVQTLTKNKKKIKFHFILSLVGFGVFFLYGLISSIYVGIQTGEILPSIASGLLMGFVSGCIGSMLGTFIKFYFSSLWEAIKSGFKTGGLAGFIGAFIGFCIAIIVGVFKCIYYAIKNTIDYIKYLKETSGFIESDTAALQQMADYMEYTLVRSRNVGVDLATLMNEDSELCNNSYAQSVVANGEEAAEANIRNVAATFNEHGEIIRSFAA